MKIISNRNHSYFINDLATAELGSIIFDTEANKMYILLNDTLNNCTTYNYETKKTGKIYDKKTTQDKYDIYLSGATPIISIENKNANRK